MNGVLLMINRVSRTGIVGSNPTCVFSFVLDLFSFNRYIKCMDSKTAAFYYNASFGHGDQRNRHCYCQIMTS